MAETGSGRAVAFVGPSIGPPAVRATWDVDFLPPIARGDLPELLRHRRPKAILIVDGAFHQRRAVLHREILQAIDWGISVWGAASMGALRACELREEGMIGVGSVYDWYCSGRIDCDGEVAVMHAEYPPYTALTIPTVTVRFAADVALRRDLISRETADHLATAAASIFYADRRLREILRFAEDSGGAGVEIARFGRFFARNEASLDVKRLDAQAALQRMGDSHEFI